MGLDSLSADALRRLNPADVRNYARSRGWERAGDYLNALAIFRRNQGGLDQLLVPLTAEIDDYTERMRDVVQKLSVIEERGPAQVFADLVALHSDIVRFSVRSPDAAKGTLPLEDGLRLVEGARRSLLAAASTVLAPNVVHHRRMARSEAEEFVQACEMGQTEVGSFVVTVRCPLRTQDEPDDPLLPIEPFGRRTTRTLMASATRIAQSVEQDQVDALLEPPANGVRVTANLCDALIRMFPEQNNSALALGVSWANGLAPAADTRELVVFHREHFNAVEYLATRLRGNEPDEARVFIGEVAELKGVVGEDGRRQGEVRLVIFDEDEVLRARANLSAEQYAAANEAHMGARKIYVQGLLKRGPRLCTIGDIVDFRLLAPQVGHDQPLIL